MNLLIRSKTPYLLHLDISFPNPELVASIHFLGPPGKAKVLEHLQGHIKKVVIGDFLMVIILTITTDRFICYDRTRRV